MNYHSLQEFVYTKMQEYHLHDPAFNFSVRRIFPAKAQYNYFIGIEKSKYFGFTFWHVPFFYSGAATDFIDYMFQQNRDGSWECHLQIVAPKIAEADQMKTNLKIALMISDALEKKSFPLIRSNSENKIYSARIHTTRFLQGQEPKLWDAFIRLYQETAPVIDQIFKDAKTEFPDWTGRRRTAEEFNQQIATMIKRRELRIQKSGANTENKSIESMESNFPLNQILYGPPGTGKTYNSISEAVKIADNQNYTDDYDFKSRFDDLRKEGRIEFVTFHQNYSYEDFMVGIRPNLDESELAFKRHYGVFYLLSKTAAKNLEDSKNSQIGIRPFEEVFEEFLRPLAEFDEGIEVKMASGKVSFHITDINTSNLSFIKQSGGDSHKLSIDTIKGLYERTRTFTSGLRYYYQPLLKRLWELGEIKINSRTQVKNYVLIIDEINRANISKVFGELITLLETDKRIGADHELRLTLPNGEKDFGVPPNLYIIGTMNTADKSIALVDIALRRRFQFKGFYPTVELLEELVNEELIKEEARQLLLHINRQIFEQKKTADFLIGHAYFIDKSENEIPLILQQNIIPLLMEYFSGKTETVKEILKGSAYPMQYDTNSYSWKAVSQ